MRVLVLKRACQIPNLTDGSAALHASLRAEPGPEQGTLDYALADSSTNAQRLASDELDDAG